MVVFQPVLQVVPGFGHGFLPVPGLLAIQWWCAISGAVQVVQLVGEFVKDHIMGAVWLGDGVFALAPGQYHLATGGSFAGDRKSTRLNSSHVRISYAVFCLKKKKKKKTQKHNQH